MHDFVAIGDIVTDAFIKLKDAHIHANLDHEAEEICMPFASKIPYESVTVVRAVGNSANAAVSASRLGLKSALISNLGDDQNGKECLESLEKDGVDQQFVTTHSGKETNYHYVLWYEADRTILVKHQEYDRKFPDIGEPKWLYLSSLGADTKEYHHQIAQYLSDHQSIQLAFQPGTFQISLGKDELADIYKRTKIFFCNVSEAEKILGVTGLEVNELMKKMRELGPEIVVITDGAKGAYAYDGTNFLFQFPYPDPKAPYERTGAGDAFASTTVAALALGKDLPTAMAWGAVNSMSVVQDIGAQRGLLGQEKIQQYLSAGPEEFSKLA